MILITGATGHLGSAVVNGLLGRLPASRISALVRDESKAFGFEERGVTIRVGDYDDAASLDRAMRGVEKVLLIAGTDEERRVEQHANVLDAAKKSGVRCIAYTSRSLKDRDTLANDLMQGHFRTEDLIRESGLSYIIFRDALYMDTIPLFVGGERVFETGINLPVGRGRTAFALRAEMGEAIANALTDPGNGGRTYSLTGSEAYSFGDVAEALSELSGADVRYTPAEPTTFQTQLKGRGVPDAQVQKTIAFLTDIKNGQEEEVSPDLEKLIGREPASLKEGLATLFKLRR